MEGFGQYGFAMALAAIFTVLAESGLFLHQSRVFPSLNQTETISRFLADGINLRLILGIISGIILIIIGQVSGKGAATGSLINLLAISIIFNNVMGGYSSYLYGTEHFGIYGILSSSTQFITTGMGILALSLSWGLVGIGWAQVVGSLITLLLVGGVVRKRYHVSTKFDFSKRLISVYKDALPLGIVAILLVFYNRVNFTLVAYFSGDNAAGIYNAAFALINGIALIGSTFSSVLLPRFSGLQLADRHTLINLYGVAFKYLLIFGLGIAFGFIFAGEPLIRIFFSEKYIESAKPLLILGFGGIFLLLNSLQQIILIARRRSSQLIRMVVMTTTANLIAAIILIPEKGYTGAALAMLIGETLGFIYGFVVNFEIMNLRKFAVLICQILPAALLILIPLKYIISLPLIVSLAMATIAYFIILLITGGINRNDMGILMGALKK